jgi:hypothetical protein
MVEIVRAKQKPVIALRTNKATLFNPMEGTVGSVSGFDDLGCIDSGKRNDVVNTTIGKMLAGGLTPKQIIEDGFRWAEAQTPPYSAKDLQEKVRYFAQKQEVEINDLDYPQDAPLHQGEACSPIRHSPMPDERKAHTTPISRPRLADEAYCGIAGNPSNM